jgi:hypothetical protein
MFIRLCAECAAKTDTAVVDVTKEEDVPCYHEP